ncbi:TetR/AcrR family transcriptional regulator [Sphingomonas aracearum]|uniref:TetR/AcrR family transcriptional regulator n=1 Tax=Sphingomonas aracearum TaxID=2283317 RepID=A0A369W0B4_9SPHN|nr:TetR/AcrR family transcriptional regulator [Sphingomonas aracearum]RDE07325.1 TetR/AcrR family transcriptional regulator [Sphingomonas aracearum]
MPDTPAAAKPVRRTQAERSAATRTALLDAAVDCLFEQGYGGTSTVLVAARAGVSRGAMLHHFPSKADLMLATLEHVLDRNHDYYTEALSRIDDPWERYAALPDLRWQLALQPHGTALMEILVGARSDEVVRARFPEFQRRLNEKQAQRLAERAQDAGLPLTAHDQAVSRTIVLALRGLAIERQVNPDVDVDSVLDVLRTLKRETMERRAAD